MTEFRNLCKMPKTTKEIWDLYVHRYQNEMKDKLWFSQSELEDIKKELKQTFIKYDWTSTQINNIINSVFANHGLESCKDNAEKSVEGVTPSKPNKNISL